MSKAIDPRIQVFIDQLDEAGWPWWEDRTDIDFEAEIERVEVALTERFAPVAWGYPPEGRAFAAFDLYTEEGDSGELGRMYEEAFWQERKEPVYRLQCSLSGFAPLCYLCWNRLDPDPSMTHGYYPTGLVMEDCAQGRVFADRVVRVLDSLGYILLTTEQGNIPWKGETLWKRLFAHDW
jgi:hypothetical protein